MDYAAVKTVASVEARFTGASVVSTPCTPRGLGRAPDSRQSLPARLGDQQLAEADAAKKSIGHE